MGWRGVVSSTWTWTTFARCSTTTSGRSRRAVAAALALTTEAEVLDAVRRQIEGMRAAGYARNETLDSETVVLSGTSAMHTADFSRRRADGTEIGRLRASYQP